MILETFRFHLVVVRYISFGDGNLELLDTKAQVEVSCGFYQSSLSSMDAILLLYYYKNASSLNSRKQVSCRKMEKEEEE